MEVSFHWSAKLRQIPQRREDELVRRKLWKVLPNAVPQRNFNA